MLLVLSTPPPCESPAVSMDWESVAVAVAAVAADATAAAACTSWEAVANALEGVKLSGRSMLLLVLCVSSSWEPLMNCGLPWLKLMSSSQDMEVATDS